MRIAQLLVGARAGDAVTEIALRNHAVFSEFASAEVVAQFVDGSVAGSVVELGRWTPLGRDDVLVLHVTIGDPSVAEVAATTDARVVVMFHNITPAHHYDEVDEEFAAMLRSGWELLGSLVGRAERVVAASTFNCADLAEVGFDRVDRLPYLVEPAARRDLVDADFAAGLQDATPGPVVLTVGQVLPHKRPELLVGAHHLLTAAHHPDATLLLVGPHPLPRFARSVQRLVRSYGLDARVRLTGPLTDAQLAECFRAADVFVTASSHEGFCVPVLEAMAFDVPVVSVGSGALPETVGGGGLVVEQRTDVLCEAIVAALAPPTAAALVEAGRRRLAELGQEDAAEALRRWTAALLAV